MSKSVRICLQVNENLYKISSLSLSNDSSLKLSVPYIEKQEISFIKFKPNYGKETYYISEDECTQKFKSNNLPQLSIHASGFVQFSGFGINSGIDLETQLAKGMGIYSAPLNNPIHTGPTFNLSFWGLEYFQKISDKRKTDLIIEQNQLIPRPSGYGDINSYIFEFFIFPGSIASNIKSSDNGENLTLLFPQYKKSLNPIFTFPVVRLLNHSSFIGILPFETFSGFAQKNKKGYVLSGPAGTDKPNEGKQNSVLMATTEKIGEGHSLDYK
jgi:YHS domain-containing protein